MTTLQIVLGIVAIVLLIAWWWTRRQSGTATTDRRSADRLDTVTGWPPQPTRVLSTPERLAFSVLTRALPGHMVLAQVPLARFLNVPRRNSYADWLRRIGNQCADFVICDMVAQVVAVVELQGTQQSDRQRKRLTRIQRTLKAAKVPLFLWNENVLPGVDAAREQILPEPEPAVATSPSPSPAPTAASAAAVAAASAAAAVNPFDEMDRDSTHDEFIELLEPPPSTWYDELDSGPTPLKKN
ncbi:MAG TPA: DUF2726 domain-containing protein [Burkholderiaceae bacterium]